jgi:type I restriction enzyme, S subunit
MIPEGWTATTIGQHADVLTGFAFKSAAYTSDAQDIKLLRGDNVAPHRLRWRDVKRFPIGRAKEVTRYHLQTGDFVVAMDRTWLPSGVKIAEVTEADLPCLLVQRVARLRAKGTLHQGLMKQFFSGHHFDQHVQAVQTETAVPHISPADLRDYPIILPPLPEQLRIAAILSTWDRAIETVEALIANARAQKKALMQSLLTGKHRLPGFSGEWATRSFGELLDLKIGGTPARNDPELWDGLNETQNHWVAISDLTGKYLNSTKERISDSGISRSNVKLLPVGTVVMSFKLSIGRKAILQVPAFTNEAICALIPKRHSGIDPLFIYHSLDAIDLEEMVDQAVKGKTLNKAKIAELRLRFPTQVEQAAIVSVLEGGDRQVATLDSQLTALRQEKSALMQQLLTGKRRVKLTEREAA